MTLGDQGGPSVAVSPDGDFSVAWERAGSTEGKDSIWSRFFTKDGLPGTGDFEVAAEENGESPGNPDVTLTDDDEVRVAFDRRAADGSELGIFSRTIRVGGEGGCSGEPAGTYMTIAELSDFGFKALITAPDGTLIDTRKDPGCISETLCVSGSVAGRSEVFLRVVGPKPNGLLWPTLVKFSTSQVEVWVRQFSTDACRKYRLAGASPGYDELQGLFDRQGFVPSAGSASTVELTAVEAGTQVDYRMLEGEDAPEPPSGEWMTAAATPDLRCDSP